MSSKTVYPARLSGTVTVPGDKSISQRVVILASLAKGTSKITDCPESEDVRSTLSAMEQMGARADFQANSLYITGVKGMLKQPEVPLDLGNSGTGARLLAGIVAGSRFRALIIGDRSLSSRPMGRILRPLEQMGAHIELTGEKGTLPMKLHGGKLRGIEYRLPMASAQIKSCVLFAGLFAEERTTVIEPGPTRDHTEKLLQELAIPVKINGPKISIEGFGPQGPSFHACDFAIPGDFSSAAFWIAATAARPGAELMIPCVGLNSRRTALLHVMRRMGAHIEEKVTKKKGDPYGNVRVWGAKLRGTVIKGDEIANLIDELPIISVAGALAEGETDIRNAVELRVKESDRITQMVRTLRLFGVETEEKKDGMVVRGPANLKTPGMKMKSGGDHRVAMSIAILGSFSNKAVTIDDADCVDTSYPTFWKHMEQLGGKVT